MSSTDADLPSEVELLDLDTITPYTNNPKAHPDDQVDKIASSIKNYGWDQPIVVDADHEIIKGHGRYLAAQQLGLDRVPSIVRADLSDAEVRAARIADNKTQMDSGWEREPLSIELDQLTEDYADADEVAAQTGFDPEEVEVHLKDQEFDPDDFFTGEPGDGSGPSDVGNGDDETLECPECGHAFAPEE